MKVLGLLAISGLIASPVQPVECLTQESVMAARVHEFSTIMLSVALRCRTINIDLSPSYEALLRTHAPAFNASTRVLEAHFRGKPRGFENYNTRLGNRYGGGATDPSICRRFASVTDDLATSPELSSLARVAFAMVPEPDITAIPCEKR